MKPSYTLRDAAQALGRSERYVWNQVRAGAIRAEKIGKALSLDAESVVAFAREHGLTLPGDNGARLPPPPPPAPARRSGDDRARGRFTFRELWAYEALRGPALEALRFFHGLPPGAGTRVAEKGAEALLQALAELAVGYNAYHLRDKLAHYGRAREQTCAAASALLVCGDLADTAEPAAALAERLEVEAVSAIGGLLRAIERKEDRHDRRHRRPEDVARS